jgi:hypothetical protein
VGWWVLVLGASASAGVATSTVGLEQMRRVVDRAFTAEMAGDLDGAASAVQGVVAEHAVTESARARAESYLARLDRRRQAFADHGPTRAGFAAGFRTLRDSPPRWSRLFWDRARDRLPELGSTAPSIDVRSRRVVGTDRDRVEAHVAAGLRAGGLEVASDDSADLILIIDLDAAEVVETRHRHQGRAEGIYGLRTPDRRAVGRGFAEHEARRPDPESARVWAARRVLDRLVDGAVFDVRLAWLEGTVSPRRSESAPP